MAAARYAQLRPLYFHRSDSRATTMARLGKCLSASEVSHCRPRFCESAQLFSKSVPPSGGAPAAMLQTKIEQGAESD